MSRLLNRLPVPDEYNHVYLWDGTHIWRVDQSTEQCSPCVFDVNIGSIAVLARTEQIVSLKTLVTDRPDIVRCSYSYAWTRLLHRFLTAGRENAG